MTKKRSTSGNSAPKTVARTTIAVQGARVHNLKNVSLEIPRDRLVVVTGLSGSGKSSLAFDTIYAEGQRRYMESLSSDAKPHVEPDPRSDPVAARGNRGRASRAAVQGVRRRAGLRLHRGTQEGVP